MPSFANRIYTGNVKKYSQLLGLEGLLASLYYRFNYIVSRDCLTINIGENEAKFHTPNDRVGERITNIFESERPVLEDLLSQVSTDDVFYDIGAHVGLYSCLVGGVLNDGRVVAFEPSTPRARLLKQNIRINGVPGSVYESALSNADDDDLDVSKYNANLKINTADELVKKEDIPNPNVVKIDIEGAELKAVEGMSDTLSDDGCRLVYCEIHPEEVKESDSDQHGLTEDEVVELIGLLESFGFTVQEIHDRGDQFFVRAAR